MGFSLETSLITHFRISFSITHCLSVSSQVEALPVYSLATPTVEGVEGVLTHIGAAPGGSKRAVLTDLREEVVVYVNGLVSYKGATRNSLSGTIVGRGERAVEEWVAYVPLGCQSLEVLAPIMLSALWISK